MNILKLIPPEKKHLWGISYQILIRFSRICIPNHPLMHGKKEVNDLNGISFAPSFPRVFPMLDCPWFR
jgi:hypothetical protein